jgi:hypothetical protein
MKVREIIEQLAKCDWDAEVRMSTNPHHHRCNLHFEESEKINSITSFRHKQKPVVTINTRSIRPVG